MFPCQLDDRDDRDRETERHRDRDRDSVGICMTGPCPPCQVDEEHLKTEITKIQESQRLIKSHVNSMSQTVSSMIVEDPQFFAFCNHGHKAKRYIPYALLFVLMVVQVAVQYHFLNKSYRAYWPKWL